MVAKNLLQITKLFCSLVVLSSLTACSTTNSDGPPSHYVSLRNVKEPVPKYEPKSKYGNPDKYTVFGKTYNTLDTSSNFIQTGVASWYGTKFHGRRTSSGEIYDMYKLTGAHKSLPLPTYAKVTNLENNKSLVIKINDRGPFHDNRVLDLSYAAAAKLGVLAKGTAKVKITAINPKRFMPDLDLDLIQVQVGAFSQRKNAQELANDLAGLIKHPVNITSEKNKNKSIYKVHLGPFPAKNLDSIKSKLASLNILNPITISKTIKTAQSRI